MNLTAVIIEDEKHNRELLQQLIQDFCPQITLSGFAGNVSDAVTLIHKVSPDLVFLDIELTGGNGFQVLEKTKDHTFQVIFTTAYEQYAIKALKMSSLDYLLKPIDLEELQTAVEKAIKWQGTNVYTRQLQELLNNVKQPISSEVRLCVPVADGFEFIKSEDISYVKAEGSYTRFHLKSQRELLVSKHLKEYEAMLPSSHFFRNHHSYLINLQEVQRYVKSDGGSVLMSNGKFLPLARSKKDPFMEAMGKLQRKNS